MKIVFVEPISQKMLFRASFVRPNFIRKLLSMGWDVLCFSGSKRRKNFLLKELSGKSLFSVVSLDLASSWKNIFPSFRRLFFLLFTQADIIDIYDNSFVIGSLILRFFRPSLTLVRRLNWISVSNRKKSIFSDALYQKALASSDGIIVDSEKTARYVRKITNSKCIILPEERNFDIPSKTLQKFFQEQKDRGLKQGSYIVCFSDFSSHPDGLHQVIRSFERLYATNKIANNTFLVVIPREELNQEQRIKSEVLSLTQPLLIFFEDKKGRDILLSQAIACVVEKTNSDFFVRAMEDASGFGIPIVFLDEKNSTSFRGFGLPSDGVEKAFTERLAYAINVPRNVISAFLECSKRRVCRKFGFTRRMKRTMSLYQDAMSMRLNKKKGIYTQHKASFHTSLTNQKRI